MTSKSQVDFLDFYRPNNNNNNVLIRTGSEFQVTPLENMARKYYSTNTRTTIIKYKRARKESAQRSIILMINSKLNTPAKS